MKKISRFFFLIGITIFAFVNLSLLTRYGDISYRGNIRFEFNKFILIFISILLLAALLLSAYYMKNITENRKSKIFISVVATTLHFAVLLIIGNELVDVPDTNWDEGFNFYNALNLFIGVPVSDYFIVYPQAIGTFAVDYLVIFIGRLLGFTEVIQYSRMLVFLNAITIEITVMCCISAVRNICKKGYAEFIAMIISYLFIPYYFYSILFYSDIYSLVFIALMIKIYANYCSGGGGKSLGYYGLQYWLLLE